jgi:hypothetical protein
MGPEDVLVKRVELVIVPYLLPVDRLIIQKPLPDPLAVNKPVVVADCDRPLARIKIVRELSL